MKPAHFGIGFCLLLSASVAGAGEPDGAVTVLDRPINFPAHGLYVGSRAPLEPSALIALPIGAVQPRGWLRETLQRQRDGLCGHLDEISAWLEKDGNAWLTRNGRGKSGWEEVPYWLRGYSALAYLLRDPRMTAETRVWIEGALRSQRPDGDFGPDQRFQDDGSRDFWANMVMLFCLETYYEHAPDPRVIDLMTRYFRFQLGLPDRMFLTHFWQKIRAGDELVSVYWLYNRTGDPSLLSLGEKIHRCAADWEKRDDLPSWHNVNIAEGFREPATHYLQSHRRSELQATYADFNLVRERYGQVPGGMFGADENCRPGRTDPRQAVEACGMVEQMFSDELLLQMTGDPLWADNCEEVAFNTYPAALTPDLRALRYLTAPNLVVCDARDHSPGIQNVGPCLMMDPFSSRCCQHNHAMGWPYFARSLWMATPDVGLCAALFSASEVTARVGAGARVRIDEDTKYPFEGTIAFTFHSDDPVRFPLYLRIPGWCAAAAVSVNGEPARAEKSAGKYLRIAREWADGDRIVLRLPMAISIRTWAGNRGSVSVDYGPLIFSLKIDERYERQDPGAAAIQGSAWQPTVDPAQWPAYAIRAMTPWNYGLMLEAPGQPASLALKTRAWPKDDYPFTPDSAPIEILARARLIPEWKLDGAGLCGMLPQSPVAGAGPVQSVTLVPMGAARLRISAFPLITAERP